ncbi:MAG: hypothetical protein JSU63_20095 [Phycisphaerales bacterium]|nr:MAG: hypothetical protein JSU63_20095 [Phycisphaerales bacterium]
MKHKRVRSCAVICSVSLLACIINVALGQDPAAQEVNGTLSEIDGVRVLRVWGSPQERGFAHGYLVGEDFTQLINGFIESGKFMDVDGYENDLLLRLKLMKVPHKYEVELRGLLSGMEARAGGPVTVPILGRSLQYKDVVAANCMGDLLRMGCSSFAAWGSMTADGHTLTGRNMDWPSCPALEGNQVVIVRTPSAGGKELGWVSVFWPGLIGCTTGMNSEGVTVGMHDSNHPDAPMIRTRDCIPSTLLYRAAIESAQARTATGDISRVLGEYHTYHGYNMMVSWPYEGSGAAAVVFEHDADRNRDGGMTIRKPGTSNAFVVCTNHFRKRYEPLQGIRFSRLRSGLGRLAGAQGSRHLTTKRAWNMLGSVPIEGIVTHHSVIFEPNTQLMRVAFAQNGQNAPHCDKVILDVTKLLAGDYPGGKK